MSSLSSKCGECVRTGKKCEPAEPVVNFSAIDKAMERLEREEERAEQAQEAAVHAQEAAVQQLRLSQAKLRRLRKQKRFLRDREQKMFDKGLADVEELERLEDLEKAAEVGKMAASVQNSDEFSSALSPGTLSWLDQTTGDFEFADTAS